MTFQYPNELSDTIETFSHRHRPQLFQLSRIDLIIQRRSGIIINISPQAGYIGFPVCSVYNSTKFALEGLIEAMTYEIEPYGI